MKEISAKSGLNQNIINQINNIFAKYPQIKKVMLYGSRAKGNYKKGSDIDLSMLGEDLTYKIQLDVFDDLDELLLPYKIDLSVFDYLDNANLRDHIERVGVVFYEREISRLPKGWEMRKLGEVCDTGAGGTPLKAHKDYYIGGTIPWLMSGEVSQGEIFEAKNFITEKGLKNSSAKLFPINTVLVAMYGATAGQVGILKFEACTNQAVCGVLPNNKTIPEYLFYCFLSKKDELVAQAVGGAQPNISQIKIRNTKIPLPPLPEQQRIVAILDQAFLAINKAKANAEANLKNAKELFESYLQGVFENKGEGWEERSLGEIADVEYGYTDKSSEEGDYRYIRITDIDKNGELILEDKKFIKYSKEAEGFIIQNNDLLMARTGATFAKVLLYNGDEPSVFASYLIRIKFKEKIENALYWYFTKTKCYWEQANNLQSGAAQPHFNGAAVKQVIFSYPKSTLDQKVLIKKFDSLSTETKKLEAIYNQKIIDLEELKKSVLQKAFAGQLIMDNG